MELKPFCGRAGRCDRLVLIVPFMELKQLSELFADFVGVS